MYQILIFYFVWVWWNKLSRVGGWAAGLIENKTNFVQSASWSWAGTELRLYLVPKFISQFFKTKQSQQNIIIFVYYLLCLSVKGRYIYNRTQGTMAWLPRTDRRKWKLDHENIFIYFLVIFYFNIFIFSLKIINILLNNSGSNKINIFEWVESK